MDRLHGFPVRKLPVRMWYLLISVQGPYIVEVAIKQREVHPGNSIVAVGISLTCRAKIYHSGHTNTQRYIGGQLAQGSTVLNPDIIGAKFNILNGEIAIGISGAIYWRPSHLKLSAIIEEIGKAAELAKPGAGPAFVVPVEKVVGVVHLQNDVAIQQENSAASSTDLSSLLP